MAVKAAAAGLARSAQLVPATLRYLFGRKRGRLQYRCGVAAAATCFRFPMLATMHSAEPSATNFAWVGTIVKE